MLVLQSCQAYVIKEIRKRAGDCVHRLHVALGPQGKLPLPTSALHPLMLCGSDTLHAHKFCLALQHRLPGTSKFSRQHLPVCCTAFFAQEDTSHNNHYVHLTCSLKCVPVYACLLLADVDSSYGVVACKGVWSPCLGYAGPEQGALTAVLCCRS